MSDENAVEKSPPSEQNLTSNLDNTQNEDDTNDSQKKTNDDADKQTGTSSSTQSTPTTTSTSNKIEIMLKAVGNAPILKKKKFALERTKSVHYIIDWLKKYMKLDPKEQLFLYVNQEFAPSPDAEIGTIYDCFKTGTNVIFHYCTTPAWG